MLCVKCEGCSWYNTINLCSGLTVFDKLYCPVEQQLSSIKVKHRFISREDKDMRPWGRRKVVG